MQTSAERYCRAVYQYEVDIECYKYGAVSVMTLSKSAMKIHHPLIHQHKPNTINTFIYYYKKPDHSTLNIQERLLKLNITITLQYKLSSQ